MARVRVVNAWGACPSRGDRYFYRGAERPINDQKILQVQPHLKVGWGPTIQKVGAVCDECGAAGIQIISEEFCEDQASVSARSSKPLRLMRAHERSEVRERRVELETSPA